MVLDCLVYTLLKSASHIASSASDWVIYKARSGRWGFKESCSFARSYRPIGGRREACGAWPGFEPTRRAKLAARTASGRAGLASAGDLAGLRRGRRAGGQASRRPEIWRGCGGGRRSGGAVAAAGALAAAWASYGVRQGSGTTDAKNRRPEGRRLFVRHGGLEPSTR